MKTSPLVKELLNLDLSMQEKPDIASKYKPRHTSDDNGTNFKNEYS